MTKITLHHGEGGQAMNNLIKNIFYEEFKNDQLNPFFDAATLCTPSSIAFTTDSFVVKPLFFSGGDIGKLAIYGTVNDLVVSGARPKYLTSSMIIEEGFELENLERIVTSMSEACKICGVHIVTGDTKVVPKHEVDGIFINTAGIGFKESNYLPKDIEEGDTLIVTGNIAEHGTVILINRYDLKVKTNMKSDCAPLIPFLDSLKPHLDDIKIMKDPTRGGLATLVQEISHYYKLDIVLDEASIPISNEVRGINQLLGIDPLYVACEGRMVLVVKKGKEKEVLRALRSTEVGQNASIIGRCMKKNSSPLVYMKTILGGNRLIPPLECLIVPRIC